MPLPRGYRGWQQLVALPQGSQPEQKSEHASHRRCHRRSHPCRPPRQLWPQERPPPFAQSRQLRARARTWGHSGLLPLHPRPPLRCPKHRKQSSPAVQPVLQEEDSPAESSSFRRPRRPFPDERPWPAGCSIVLQRPGTLLQAERPGFGPAPSPLRWLRHSLKHERPQPTGCTWLQRRPLTPMHFEQSGDGPPVQSSPIPHQPRLKSSSRFVPWQSSPATT